MTTEERVAALRAELARTNEEADALAARVTQILESNPQGIAIASLDGSLRVNDAGAAILGALADANGADAWASQYGLFLEDQKTPHPTDALPLARALLHRVVVLDHRLWMRSAARPDGAWLSVSAFPLEDGTAIAIFRDVTDVEALTRRLQARNDELEARDAENRVLVERLRVALEELSTPVLEVWDGVLAVPVVGLLDTQRSHQMTERVLDAVSEGDARFVIVDLTGVEVVDTSTADRLIKLAAGVRLLGAQCVVSGIQPAVAQTLVAIGVELHGLVARHDLEHALAYCRALEARGRAALAQGS